MKKVDMTGEYVIPNVEAGEASPTRASQMDNDAFASFYQRSASSLWAYLARVSGNPGLADDLVQESYLRFLCASVPADGEVACRRYLFRIATNLLRDHWRRPHLTSIEELPEGVFASNGNLEQIGSTSMLGPALAQLRLRDRQLLWLAYAEGYTHREIAEITGLGAASVRLLLFRARRKIARLLRTRSEGDRKSS